MKKTHNNFYFTGDVNFLLKLQPAGFLCFSKYLPKRRAISQLRKDILRSEKNTGRNEKSLTRFLGGVKKEEELIESVFLKKTEDAAYKRPGVNRIKFRGVF